MDVTQDEAKFFFEETMKKAKRQIEIIDAQIEEELARVKETINAFQEQKKALRKIYDGAVDILGVENEFEKEEKENENENEKTTA